MNEDIDNFIKQRLKPEYYEKFQYSYDEGRRIRPLMMQKICERFGKDFGTLSTAAAAIEILHCASLMHDDIIDSDDSRRGKPAFHKAFGVKEGVLYGDLFATLSWELVANKYPKIIQAAFIKSIREIIEGQIMELKGVEDIDSYLEYVRKKTSTLFHLSANVPYIIFKLNNAKILDFGREFGMVFQIANDLKAKTRERFSILNFMSKKEAEDLLTTKVEYINSLDIVKVESLGF